MLVPATILALSTLAAAGNVPSSQAGIAPTSILVVTDRSDNSSFAPLHAEQVANALTHFTPNTSWVYVDKLTTAQAERAGAIVYLGDNGSAPVPTSAMKAFSKEKILVLTRFHIHQFHDAKIAFMHVTEGNDVRTNGALDASYHGQEVSVQQSDYVNLTLAGPAEAISSFRVGGGSVPYIVRDGDATFINGTIDYDHLEARPNAFGAAIVISDALNDALHATPVSTAHLALLRLEDVSVQTPAPQLRAIVDYLADEHVPYGIGLIPDQLIKGETLKTLSQDPELVSILQIAKAHGATIILHGLHHSYNSPEDFEFWDHAHDRPIAGDSAVWMDDKISQGMKIEDALGLQPRMWETPHYSASTTDYREVSKYFHAAWEDRPLNGWLPWALKRDTFGAELLPENLGYVANDGSTTVANQLAIAKLLLMCRGCVAAGFLHPATIPLATFQEYVSGLRSLGYQFADPGALKP